MKKFLLSAASASLIFILTVACSNGEANQMESQEQEQTTTPAQDSPNYTTGETTSGNSGGNTGGNADGEAGVEVTVLIDESGMFNTPELRIKKGTKVTWVNNDDIAHNVYEMNNLFQSENLDQGSTFSYTFDQPGEYTYYCSIHPSMEARVIVEE